MPHADSSYFAAGSSKDQVYEQVLEQAQGLLTGQRNWVCNCSVTSLLWHGYAALPEPSSAVNWAGFYIRDDLFPTTRSNSGGVSGENKKLLLGPFQGKPACQEIKFGRGVCGTAAFKKETVVVADVFEFPGHIACDADSRSEIVVPILFGGETVAIIDIDCAQPAGFDEVDRKHLEKLAALIAESCDWCHGTDSSSTHINNSFIDLCFEQPTTTTTSDSSDIPHRVPSSWSDPCQVVSTVESLEQLPGSFDFDFLFAPTTTTSSTSSHTASISPGQTDLPLDFSSHEFDHTLDLTPQHWFPDLGGVGEHTADMLHHTPGGGSSASALLSGHSASLDMVSLEMDRFAASTTSTHFDNSNHTTSPDSMTSLPYSRDRPLLAPKQTTTITTPPSSSLSASPSVSLIDTATTATNKSATTGKKRSRAESATVAVDSSNNSVEDSEEERAVEKRRRNTMAARRFRKRKLDHVSELESKLAKVTGERDELKLQIAKWEGEVMALRKLMERKDT
ncbi:uncharacterized protein TRUGW13939_03953 [Talaromyces rugulosus]|uniref:BZIP domain-containing protein n=1 Tax=Talaromyces rugulosus TaxID=121627 RepID=A0A7H8QSM6_TALRU|nr:uncharacterized protein TRUGW13939_03953 [Talaromyces rugulosus]QKX56846.1 hypothetical protein TRUGW13939_03953 [Talaromyces rugulosus]